MLDLITKSKIRQRIILLFVYNPGKEYYVNEVARLVKTSSGTAQRELERLKKSGLLKKEKKASLAYFRIQSDNSIFQDVKNIVDKTIGLRNILEEELKGVKGMGFAFIFGSYAKGGFGPSSDVDVYVIGNVSEGEVHRKIRKVENKVYREINYHISTLEEFMEKLKKSFFHNEILKKSVLIVGDENEFKKIIK